MLICLQQPTRTTSAWIASIFSVFQLTGLLIVLGCESPPRPNAWEDEPAGPRLMASAGEVVGELTPQPTRDNTLRIHLDADPGSLNPMRAPSKWTRRIMMDNVFETLLRYGPATPSSGDAGPGRFEAGLAQTWTVGLGGREIRLSLHPDAKFHDGKSVTALDVQFSLEAAMTKRGGAPHHRRALSSLVAVEIVNRKMVRLRLSRSDGFVLRELARIPIMPEHVYLKKLSQKQGQWIGSGPYKVTRREEDLLLTRDANYWSKAPAIEHVEFVRHQDSALALREAKEGQMDFVPALIAEHYPEQIAAPGLAIAFFPVDFSPAQFSYIVFNTSQPPFDNINLRRAIAYLIDGKVGSEQSLSRRVAGPVWPGGPGDSTGPAPLPHDLTEAARLLEVAGWRDDDGDSVRSKDGQRLMVTVLATDSPHPLRDTTLGLLRKAGLVLDVRVGSAAVLRNRLRDGEFQLAFVTWSGARDSDLSSLLGSGGKLNYGRFHSVEVDSILAEVRSVWQPSQRAPLVSRLAKAVQRTMPIVALSAPNIHGLVSKRITGFQIWDGWFSLRDLAFRQDPVH